MVSIRARQLRRANPQRRSQTRRSWWRFNPRPPIKAGESARFVWRWATGRRFNPRPPIKAGESGLKPFTDLIASVSIRARQLRRANPLWKQVRPGLEHVSIRARQLRRANRCDRHAVGDGGRGFNPRPPIKAGESVRPPLSVRFPARFQSAPAN